MEIKFVKAYCAKTGKHFGLKLAQYGSEWKVVDMIPVDDSDYKLITSELHLDKYYTNSNLKACEKCGNRLVGGCRCANRFQVCTKSMKYRFACIYCSEFTPDYSLPSARDVAGKKGKTLSLGQNIDVKIITFSNVEWKKYDNMRYHEGAGSYSRIEPRVHVVCEQKNIEFHGYNVSAMDEGVYYCFDPQDGFDITCDVDTSTIKPHPGGALTIKLGIISAVIDENGGAFTIGGQQVSKVGSKFKMRLSFTNGSTYKVEINNRLVGNVNHPERSEIRVDFNFSHDSHCCELLSHAYIKNIAMQQGALQQ